MKINKRIFIAFFLLLLIPLLTSHIAAYILGSRMLTDRVRSQVESVAAIQKERVTMLMDRNLERLALVLSRTQLRHSLNAYLQGEQAGHLEKITRIIADARASIAPFEAISVADMDGRVLASTDESLVGSKQTDAPWFNQARQKARSDFLFLDPNGRLKFLLSGPLNHEGNAIGVLFITSKADNLLQITQDYSGLGATGETLLAKKDATGRILIIPPLRFDPLATLKRTFSAHSPHCPIAQAVLGQRHETLDETVDYRGQKVIAATVFLPQLGWGLAVKIDRDEALAPITRLQVFLVWVLALSLVMTSLVSLWLSQTITKPLSKLVQAAEHIGEGNLSEPLRGVHSRDEIGLLAATFEEMRRKLNLLLGELREETTQRTLSEGRYRELVDNIGSGVAMFRFVEQTQTFVLTEINKAGLNILKHNGNDDMVGRPADMLHPGFAEFSVQEMLKRVYTSRLAEFHPPRLYGDSETGQWLQHYLYVLPSNEVIVVFEDVTRQKIHEEEKDRLEALNWQLQKVESLHRMAGAIAHHFNNALTAVSGNLELALDEASYCSGAQRYISNALEATLRATKISAQMLTYLGQGRGTNETIDLVALCREHLAYLQASAPGLVTLRGEFPLQAPTIAAPPDQIRQVLTNIVTNACEATAETAGEITLSVETVTAEEIPTRHRFPAGWSPRAPHYAMVRIADNGNGIIPENIEKIFDPFFSTKFTGRGLGLAVALGILTAIEGAITVESHPDTGTAFGLFLPLIRPKEEATQDRSLQ